LEGFKVGGRSDGLEGDFVGLLFGALKRTVDIYICILIEARVAFHARLGLGAAFDDREIIAEETDLPLEAFAGIVVLEVMSTALCYFDEVSVGLTASRPCLREMVGVELEETFGAGIMAQDDVFAVMTSFFLRVHCTPEVINELNWRKIAYSACSRAGNRRKFDKCANRVLQTVNYLRFQVP
jgi:hypothetical protein